MQFFALRNPLEAIILNLSALRNAYKFLVRKSERRRRRYRREDNVHTDLKNTVYVREYTGFSWLRTKSDVGLVSAAMELQVP
jgi:hypothetical protein